LNVLAVTVWREARSLGEAGICAVYHVIYNRANDPRKRWPQDLEMCCLEAYQFSCWNSSDPQRNLYPKAGDQQYAKVCAVNSLPASDPTYGANMYYDNSIPPPSWATPDKFTVQIGNLRFFKI
jgi:spore germination cell wall hydrolase CwlJ-like protein